MAASALAVERDAWRAPLTAPAIVAHAARLGNQPAVDRMTAVIGDACCDRRAL